MGMAQKSRHEGTPRPTKSMPRAEHETYRQADVGQVSPLWWQCFDCAKALLVSWASVCDKVWFEFKISLWDPRAHIFVCLQYKWFSITFPWYRFRWTQSVLDLVGHNQCVHRRGQRLVSCIAFGLALASCKSVWGPDATKKIGRDCAESACLCISLCVLYF